jgi:hypothetical protein
MTGRKDKHTESWTPQLVVVITGVTLMTLSLLTSAFFPKQDVATSLSWLVGMLLIVIATCFLVERRRQPWRMVLASLGAALVATSVCVSLWAKQWSNSTTAVAGFAVLGLVLLTCALFIDVSTSEIDAAALGVVSILVGGALVSFAIRGKASAGKWTAALIAATVLGVVVTATGKLGFVVNVNE